MVLEDRRGLSLREKIGQTMIVKADPERQIAEFGSLGAFLAAYPVGGVFIAPESLTDPAGRYGDVPALARAYREASRIPLLIAADAENGCGSFSAEMTVLPHLMALGATGSTELAYAYGKTIALEARALGIDWSFSPVADLNLNPLNPITNIRAIGDEAEPAIRLLTAVVRGMQDHGLSATAKHFPGDGVDRRDQHLVTTCNSLSREDWRRKHGAVFAALIGAGIDAVMTGHISLPAYPGENAEGRRLPATLSFDLTTRLLKQELDFGGVVVSDALDMGGFLKCLGRERGELECFRAGTDMLLWPSLGFLDRLEQAVITGDVPLARLDDALARIWRLKEKRGLLAGSRLDRRELSVDERLYTRETAGRVAEGSITLVRDRLGLLPLRPGSPGRILIVAITPHDRSYAMLSVLKEALRELGVQVTLRRNIQPGEMGDAAQDHDLILYAPVSCPHRPRGPLGFVGPEADSIWASLISCPGRSIVVSFGSPYHGDEYFEAADVYVNAYSIEEVSQLAAARALFGEIRFAGHSPVRLGPGGAIQMPPRGNGGRVEESTA